MLPRHGVFFHCLGPLAHRWGLFFVIHCVSVFCAQSTRSPLIGGSLAKPAERFPAIFGDSAFHKEYPYFLPCAVSATVTALLCLIVFMFMTEVHEMF